MQSGQWLLAAERGLSPGALADESRKRPVREAGQTQNVAFGHLFTHCELLDRLERLDGLLTHDDQAVGSNFRPL